MPRIRTVKPAFFFDEELAKLPPMTRLFFIGLFTQADKGGKMEDKPNQLKAQIFPYERFNAESALQKLSAHFLIRYKVDGKRYIKIRTFEKHQRPHHTESESEIPEPNGSLTVKQRLLNAKEGKGKEGKGKEGAPPDGGGKQNFVEIPDDLKQNEPEIQEWLAYKRERGETYKPRGLSALWAALRRIHQEDRAESVRFCMASNYAGLFPKRPDPGRVIKPPPHPSGKSQAERWVEAGLSFCHGSSITEHDDGKRRCDSCLLVQEFAQNMMAELKS